MPAASQALAAANLHPMPRDRSAVLRISAAAAPIAGRFVEVAGAATAVDNLSNVIIDLGLPAALFAPVAWGTLDRLPPPDKNLGIPWSFDF